MQMRALQAKVKKDREEYEAAGEAELRAEKEAHSKGGFLRYHIFMLFTFTFAPQPTTTTTKVNGMNTWYLKSSL